MYRADDGRQEEVGGKVEGIVKGERMAMEKDEFFYFFFLFSLYVCVLLKVVVCSGTEESVQIKSEIKSAKNQNAHTLDITSVRSPLS